MPHLLLLLLTASFLGAAASEWPTRITLNVGETVNASRNGGSAHQFKLLSISHQTMPYRRNAADATIFYAATAQLEIDGAPVTLTARPYQFPTVAGGLRLLIENTKIWSESGTFAATAHAQDLSLTFTNAGESWGPSDTRFPIGQFRWHATTYHNTWMGLVPQDADIYYHRGEDFGAQPNLLPLFAIRDGTVTATPAVLLRDGDGAVFRFNHMFEDHIYVTAGQNVASGATMAHTGGRGNSGSDPHLHLNFTAPDGTSRNTYPLMAEAYLRDYPDSGLANAGGYQFMIQGQTIVLDGSRSLARPGRSITGHRWILHDGTQVDGPTANLTIATPGYYAQELRVTYDDGSEQRDFTPVRVFGDGAGQTGILGLIYQYPVRGISPGTAVTIQHNTWIPGSGVGARTIDFGDGTAPQAFSGTLAHSYAAPGIYTVTIAADTTQVLKTSVLVDGTVPTNVSPAVNAGPDRAITLPATASLDGTVSDDGLPAGSSLTQTWTTVSGPGTVTFGNANAVDTSAAFSAAGTYVLRLTASDGSLSANDTVTVVVTAAPASNTAPVVSAGPDRAITLPATASLDGTVGDDGLPAGSSLTQTWTTVSGPGTITFANAGAVDTTAAFSATGTYVLRLTASDGTLSANDTVTVVVMPPATVAATPTANTLTVTSGSAGGSCGAGAFAGFLLAGVFLVGLRRR